MLSRGSQGALVCSRRLLMWTVNLPTDRFTLWRTVMIPTTEAEGFALGLDAQQLYIRRVVYRGAHKTLCS